MIITEEMYKEALLKQCESMDKVNNLLVENQKLKVVEPFDLERFLNDEKNNFCKFRCQYSKGEPIKVECEYCIIDCYECEESINIEGENIEIEPCDYCILNEFIREIRDRKVKVLE